MPNMQQERKVYSVPNDEWRRDSAENLTQKAATPARCRCSAKVDRQKGGHAYKYPPNFPPFEMLTNPCGVWARGHFNLVILFLIVSRRRALPIFRSHFRPF